MFTEGVVNLSGYVMFWILLTIILTTMILRGTMQILIVNPLLLIGFIFSLVVVYIVFSAIMILFGVADVIDNSIQGIVNIVTSMRGT